MRIALVTPARHGSKAGNRVTARRWAQLLRQLGHRVELLVDYAGEAVDAMIALHAYRSAAAVAAYRERYPDGPLVVALTGTDIYSFLASHPQETLATMQQADLLIALHARVANDIPARFHDKLHLVLQSARPPARRPSPLRRCFEVCVSGHLRDEKDPLRAAEAVRDLPASSRLRVSQVGTALDERWAARARAEMQRNPRYHWYGEVAHARARQLLARAQLMVLSSVMEGGANVLFEACAAGVPIVASAISSNRGLLGEGYPGFFPLRDTAALRAQLLRCEQDAACLDQLRQHCVALGKRFSVDNEREALRRLMERCVRR